MNDHGKRDYYGPSVREIQARRRKAKLQWLNSLRKAHSR